jgi:hypothetical protein
VNGRVLSGSAIVDITTRSSVYGAAFLVASVELGMTLVAPSTALLQAWAAVEPPDRALLELLQEAPTLVVDDLSAATATSAGVRAHGASAVGAFDAAAAHAVELAVQRDYPILTADPGPLRAIDAAVSIEELPA